jgi:hypothetical protein
MRYPIILLVHVITTNLLANTNNSTIPVTKLDLQKKYIASINQCSTPYRLANKIKSALKNVDDYEIKAINAGQFEEIIMCNPSCFVDAMNKLTKNQCLQATSAFVNETFFYPREDIKQALNSEKTYRLNCMAS